MNERELFQAAMEISDAADRRAYLDQACANNPALREQVERLLTSHAEASRFLATPAAEQLASPSVDENAATSVLPRGATPSPEPTQTEEEDEFLRGILEPSSKAGSRGRLAHYEVLEILGRGAFGIVLKAFDEKLHRMVAIKVMNLELAATSPPRKRFLREAQSSAKIRHENIVAIHNVEEQPLPYLVMEYIPGGTLQQRLDQHGPLDLEEILRIGQQIALGLSAAHAQGLIHRDIKPANILLESGVEERAKITDFGLARATDDASLTQSGLIAGTPMFMSPEQAKGQPLDHRTDLFSLGSVLYTMASGRPPFRAPNTIAVLKRVCDDVPRPIAEVIPEIPSWLCDIISKLHAKEPEDRYQSAKEVADALAKAFDYLQNPAAAPQPRIAEIPQTITGTTDEAALKSLRGPGLGLIITACLNVIDMIGLMLAIVLVWNRPENGHFHVGFAELLLLMIVFVGSGVMLIAGLKMIRGRSYWLCVLGCVAALFVGPMYIVGWPVAIWALIVLSRDRVREVFQRSDSLAAIPSRHRPAMPVWAAVILALCLLPVLGCVLVVVGLGLPAYQAAVARATQGTLIVQSDEPFVTALVDDRRMPLPGKEEIELKLPAGTHTVTFFKDGVKLDTRVLKINAGQNHVARWPDKPGTVLVDVSPPDAAWESLFNGRDLTGWMTHPQQSGNWRVEDGLLVGSGSVSHLFTERDDLHDFEFRGEVRLNQDGNSGVFLRTPFAMTDPNSAVTSPPGYEVQLIAGNQIQPTQSYISGGVIPLFQPQGANLIQKNQWYKFRVKAVGDKFETWIDDVQTVSTIDPQRKYQGGHLALQMWSTETKVDFRNLQVRQLGPAFTPQVRPSRPDFAIAPFDAKQAKTYQEACAKVLGIPVEYTDKMGMRFSLIPPGEFLMGATDEETQQLSRELVQAGANDFDQFVARMAGPQHRVTLTQPFYLAQHEVTVAQYRQFIDAARHLPTSEQLGVKRFQWQDSAAEPNGEQRAVIGVSWEDAAAFCRWASTQHGMTYELPTEAQWEFACRAGTTTLWSFGDDVAQLPDYAVFGRASFWPAEVVGSKQPNPFGLWDMHGNADEWCRDWHDSDFYKTGPHHDPAYLANPKDKNSGRVARGGTAGSAPWWTRSTTRPWDFSATPNNPKGFRVSLSVDSVRKIMPVTSATDQQQMDNDESVDVLPLLR